MQAEDHVNGLHPADVSEIMKQAGLRDITVVKDLAGLDRVVMGRK